MELSLSAIPRPEKVFNQIGCLVVPSQWEEPFGRVVVESYGYGVPVIGSNCGGIPELIDDGVTGWIFKSESRGELEKKNVPSSRKRFWFIEKKLHRQSQNVHHGELCESI